MTTFARTRVVRSLASGLAIGLLTLVTPASESVADAPDEVVVARVGKRTITAGELNRRIAGTPPFQLRRLGGSAEEIRRNYLDQVLVRELLWAEGAQARGLDERPELADRVRRELRRAILADIRKQALSDAPITDEDVEKYYASHRDRFQSPDRIGIWRILLETRSEAEAVLREVKEDLTPATWNRVARERSVDKASRMRGGNLGFVAPDGKTSQAGVVVDPALYEAALGVEDASLVSEPVAEGRRFAVLWRRQSMKAVSRSLESERSSIRQLLSHARYEEKVDELLAGLREKHVSSVSEELIDHLEVTPSGTIERGKRPGVLPKSRTRSAQPVPRQGSDGLR